MKSKQNSVGSAPTRQYRHLGVRLLLSIVLFSAVITAILTAIQLHVDYRKDVTAIGERLQQIDLGSVEALTNAVWNFDIPALKTHLASLQRIPDISYVTVDAPGLVSLAFGNADDKNTIVRTYALTHKKAGNAVPIGTLKVHASLDSAIRRTWERLWIILAAQTLKTFIVSGFILYLIHRLVTRRLATIAELARPTRDDVASEPMELLIKQTGAADEIDSLVETLNAMRKANATLYQDLYLQKSQLQGVLDNTTAVIFAKDIAGRYLFVNRQFEQVTQLKSADVIGKTDHDLFPPEYADSYRANDLEVFATNAPIEREEMATFLDGIHTYIALKFPLTDAIGKTYGMCGILTDITQRVHMEAALFAAKERAQVTLDSIGDAVITTDANGQIDYLNPVACRLTGWDAADAMGVPLAQVFNVINEITRQAVTSPFELVMQRKSVVGLANHSVLIHRDGTETPIEDSGAPIRDRDGNIIGVVLVFHDVSLKHKLAIQLEYQATHDALTGLPNRNLLMDRYDHAAGFSRRHGQQFALFFMDLDNFKNINDSLGHSVGDRILQRVAERLLSCVRSSDTVSRQGGDEFIVLMEEVESTQTMTQMAEKILAAIAVPYRIDDYELAITASIGICVYPDDGVRAEDLIKHADAAMYLAKASGKNGYRFFTIDMNVRALERIKLENALRYALANNEFVLHYQPKISLISGRVVGAEALLRWPHPEYGLVSPSLFIAIAEECGFILQIGHWVLNEACRQIRRWRDAGLPVVPIAVNLSAMQFKKADLVQDVVDALANAELEAYWLELELTESMMMEGQHDVATMTALKNLGVSLSIDDFGTGYSSLSYLRRFPINALKIDQAFVRHIANEPDDDAVVSAIINLAHSLRLKVIAEGVETRDQVERLKVHGCDQIQGYYFSPPVSADELQVIMYRVL